jgi:hypothetical protein
MSRFVPSDQLEVVVVVVVVVVVCCVLGLPRITMGLYKV